MTKVIAEYDDGSTIEYTLEKGSYSVSAFKQFMSMWGAFASIKATCNKEVI